MHQNAPLKISIVIPVINEAENLGSLLGFLRNNSQTNQIEEIIVVDGGSTDQTIAIAKELGAIIGHSEKGRAKQMNHGAKMAKGSILYFLHADTFPPKNFDTHILNAVTNGTSAGCFRMKFDSQNWLLKVSAWLTRINHRICRGGDQSLFISKALWHRSKGFNETYIIYEDTEFIGRLYTLEGFKVLPQEVLTSARKYNKNGTIRLQFHFGMIHLINLMGAGPERLNRYYQKNITT